MDLDLEEEGADKLDADDEERYFSMLSGDNIGKALTNKAEYLLMTQAMKGETKVSEEEDASGCLLTHCNLVDVRTLHSGSDWGLSTTSATCLNKSTDTSLCLLFTTRRRTNAY